MARDCKSSGSYKEFLKFKSLTNNPNHPLHSSSSNKKPKVQINIRNDVCDHFRVRSIDPAMRIDESIKTTCVIDEKDMASSKEIECKDGNDSPSDVVRNDDSETESCHDVDSISAGNVELPNVSLMNKHDDYMCLNALSDAQANFLLENVAMCMGVTPDVCSLADAALMPMRLCASNATKCAMQSKPCMDSGASTCFFNDLTHFQSLKTIPEVHVSLGE